MPTSNPPSFSRSAAHPKIKTPTQTFRALFASQSLARQLQLANLHTAPIPPLGQRHSAPWSYAGFHEIHNTGQGGMESAEVVMPVVKDWFAANQTWLDNISTSTSIRQ